MSVTPPSATRPDERVAGQLSHGGRIRGRVLGGLAVFTLLILVSHVVGMVLQSHGKDVLRIGQTYPIAGAWRTAVTPWMAVPVLAAGLVWWGWPRLVARLSWRRLLVASTLTAAAWSVAASLAGGPAELTNPLSSHYQYPHDVPRVHDLGSFLGTFHEHVVDPTNGPVWAVHVGGHPPGVLGVFVVLDRIGLGGLGWAAALCVVGGALAVPSVLATVKLFGGARFARYAALFVPVAPAALWIASTADAFFAGVAAAGLCALAHAAARRDRRGDLLAALGGLALGCCLFLSYGLSLMVAPALAVVLIQRRVRPLLIGGVVVFALLGAAYLDGFNWWQGLQLAAERTRSGRLGPHGPVAWQVRPTWYFVLSNPSALAVSVGPVTVAGLALLRRARVTVLAAGTLLAVFGAVASNLSKGEVARIYLPFAMWLLPFAALWAWQSGGAPGRPDREGEGRRDQSVESGEIGQFEHAAQPRWSARSTTSILLAVQLAWTVLIAVVIRTWW